MEQKIISDIKILDGYSVVYLDHINKDGNNLTKFFDTLVEYQVNLSVVSQINTTIDQASMAVENQYMDKLKLALDSLDKTPNVYDKNDIGISTDLAKIVIEGIGIVDITVSRVFMALAKNNIDIKMISCSEISMSCIVESTKAEIAQKALINILKQGGGNE